MSRRSRYARKRLVWLAGVHDDIMLRTRAVLAAAWWSAEPEDTRKTVLIRVPRSLRKYIGSTLRVLA